MYPVTTSYTHTLCDILPQWRRRGGRRDQLHDPRDPMRRGRKAQSGTQGQGRDACTHLCVVDAKLSRVTIASRYRHTSLARIPLRMHSTVIHAPLRKPDSAGPVFTLVFTKCSPTHATLGRGLLTRRHHYPALSRINQQSPPRLSP